MQPSRPAGNLKASLVGVVALCAVAVIGAPLAAQARNTTAPSDPGPPPHVLDRDMRGEAAIQALGNRLPAVAAENGMSPGEFMRSLRSDHMLWVGQTGRLLYVDEFDGHDTHDHEVDVWDEDHHHDHDHGHDETPEPDLAETTDPLFGTYSTSQAFTLNSKPGAARTIYLDFDGFDARGTAWDTTSSPEGVIAAPYDLDGNPNTFSDAERRVVIDVWRHVAEDYAPFDINVTTQDPGQAAITRDGSTDLNFGTRVALTPTKTYNCSCGGVAYIANFGTTSRHAYYQPAWVFTKSFGSNAKNLAEAASHEAGHNLGPQPRQRHQHLLLGPQRLGADHGHRVLPAAHPMVKR